METDAPPTGSPEPPAARVRHGLLRPAPPSRRSCRRGLGRRPGGPRHRTASCVTLFELDRLGLRAARSSGVRRSPSSTRSPSRAASSGSDWRTGPRASAGRSASARATASRWPTRSSSRRSSTRARRPSTRRTRTSSATTAPSTSSCLRPQGPPRLDPGRGHEHGGARRAPGLRPVVRRARRPAREPDPGPDEGSGQIGVKSRSSGAHAHRVGRDSTRSRRTS